MPPPSPIAITTKSKFILSTSGSDSSLLKHNAMIKYFGVDFVYFTFSHKVTAEQYANLLRAPITQGGAVTGQGLKTDIIPHLDVIDDYANALQSVNTVINKEGKLHGYNTDAYGFETALRDFLTQTNTTLNTAVIYGNGGVSSVAYAILCKLGIRTTMRGRNTKHVEAKMSQLSIDDFAGPYDLVVNATPASNNPIHEAFGLEELCSTAKVIFDHNMPEKDSRTNYLADYCVDRQLHFISGRQMYLPQMIKQWSLFLSGQVSETELNAYVR